MDDARIQEVAQGMKNLPTLPGIAIRILELIQKEDASLREMSDILSTDPPLSAKVLALINSAFYSLPVKVTSVLHAVQLLGMNAIKNLALSFSLIKIHKKDNKSDFNYVEFWKSSLIGAISARLLTQEMLPSFAEDAFFLGLLHNIGILALNESMPKQYSLVIKERNVSLSSYHEAENQIIGFNHMELGGHLVKSWGLPDTFFEPISHHHCPETLKTPKVEIDTLTKILHLSSLIIDFFVLSEKSFSLGILEWYGKGYGLTSKVQIAATIEQTHKQAVDIFPLFEIKIEEEEDYYQILEDARAALINLSSEAVVSLVEQRKQIETLKEQTMQDGLTELSNYKGFHSSLDKECYRAKRYNVPISLIIADIDYFKRINDTYGHLAGDCALKTIAQALNSSLRNSDIVARHGGEEFGIILPETAVENAVIVAERLRKRVESLPIEYEGKKLSVTMSFGIASLPLIGNITKEEFIRRADTALYRAKTTGKNRCCIFDANRSSARVQNTARAVRLVR